MFDFLALITQKKYWRLHSIIIKYILKLYGVKVGRKFYIEGVPKLKLKGKPQNLIIGDHVSIFGNIDIRNRENGKIIFEDNISIDNDCRFVAANNAVLKIGERTGIGCYSIFNCGSNVTIGKDCLLSGMIHIQSSEHGFAKGILVSQQRHTYGEIVIGNDVWIAVNAAIMKGVKLGNGCVVGAKSLVRAGEFPDNSIIAGIPAKIIKKRI